MTDKIPGNEMIVIDDLHKFFGNVEAVKVIDLRVKRGEVVIIVGPSGSGKSTVLRCINHLEVPTAVAVEIVAPPVAPLSVTVNPSSASTTVSPLTSRLIVRLVWLAANVTVPLGSVPPKSAALAGSPPLPVTA